MYHYFDSAGVWHLLDGDKIAALAATFIADQLSALGWPIVPPAHDGSGAAAGPSGVSVGVVQTAYANGASTAYIRDKLRLPVPMAKTGVKFVHHRAQEYDIGIYFEANGHGTVLFSRAFITALKNADPASLGAAAALARARLLGASLLINQAIGDAISDALFVEAVLALKGWSVQQWDAMYADLPSRQLKLPVADRAVITTTEDETAVTSPDELQREISRLAAAVPKGRAFVRPSGTEDVVRVYAEAAAQSAADELAYQVACAAYQIAGGVGPRPVKP